MQTYMINVCSFVLYFLKWNLDADYGTIRYGNITLFFCSHRARVFLIYMDEFLVIFNSGKKIGLCFEAILKLFEGLNMIFS